MAKLEGTVLIVDDDEDVLLTAEMIFTQKFRKVITLANPDRLSRTLGENEVDVIFLDMNFKTGRTDGREGMFLLREILKVDPQAYVVMQTAYGDIDIAVESMKIGALDFITKPWNKEKLLTTAVNLYKLRQSNKEIQKLKAQKEILSSDLNEQFGEILGNSKAMGVVFETIKKVADTGANVLILGENGTGKELVARRLHQLSKVKGESFVKVDLGTLTESLAESLLFGHVKGAFTDAKEDKIGFFEQADGGTLFLDEIGNIPLSLQSKLLTAIQYGHITKVGSSVARQVNVRLLCATNKSLYHMVEEGSFRQDLLYRINTVEIRVPPLRERKGDVPLLVSHFLRKFCNRYNKPTFKVASFTIKKLEQYDWPGNIRELEHATERAVIMASGKTLTPDDFMLKKSTLENGREWQSLNIDDVEKRVIEAAVEKCEGNLTRAALSLGMGRSTLYRKMKKFHLL